MKQSMQIWRVSGSDDVKIRALFRYKWFRPRNVEGFNQLFNREDFDLKSWLKTATKEFESTPRLRREQTDGSRVSIRLAQVGVPCIHPAALPRCPPPRRAASASCPAPNWSRWQHSPGPALGILAFAAGCRG